MKMNTDFWQVLVGDCKGMVAFSFLSQEEAEEFSKEQAEYDQDVILQYVSWELPVEGK